MTTPAHAADLQARRAVLADLGARIQLVRRQRGLTQAQLAQALSCSVAYVSLIERGGRNPRYTTVVAIARVLDVPTDLLTPDG